MAPLESGLEANQQMQKLRLTVVMKIDIGGSTSLFRALSSGELTKFLSEHRDFVVRTAAANEGTIVKGEGDAFWLTFPSVAAAARAAIEMQAELRYRQANKGDDRVTMRIVITLGDVLREEGDFFGEAVTLAARMEAITPADEIYMSPAARFSVGNAEVSTTLVDTFAFKGFPEPIPVYRVQRPDRTQLIGNQYIVWIDLRGFSRLLGTPEVTQIERVLGKLAVLVDQVRRRFDGNNRFSVGDAHCLTFTDARNAMSAAEQLVEEWRAFDKAEQVNCPMAAALHKGSLYLFGSYIYGQDINIVARLVGSDLSRSDPSILVTGPARGDLVDTDWYLRLSPIDIGQLRPSSNIDIFRLAQT